MKINPNSLFLIYHLSNQNNCFLYVDLFKLCCPHSLSFYDAIRMKSLALALLSRGILVAIGKPFYVPLPHSQDCDPVLFVMQFIYSDISQLKKIQVQDSG